MPLYDSLVEFGTEQGISKGRKEGFEQGISKGREQGREEGREEGQEQTKREAILIGYKNGIPIDILSLQTGYTTKEVQRILEQK